MKVSPPPELSKLISEFQESRSALQRQIAEMTSAFDAATKAALGKLMEPGRLEASIRRGREGALRLAELGWTVPPWSTLRLLYDLSEQSSEEVDATFVDIYLSDGGTTLGQTLSRLLGSRNVTKWRELLLQTGACLKRSEHLVAIPSLLVILEGYVAQFATANKNQMRDTDVKRLVEQIGKLHREEGSVLTLAWSTVRIFIWNLFAQADFTCTPPSFINRNWILHGRANPSDWRMADALRLLNAVSTMDFVRGG